MVLGRDPDIERAVGGDGRAATELVATLLPMIRRRVTRALTRDKARWGRAVALDVDDLTQEVLLALFSDQGRILRAWTPERGLPLDEFVGLVARRRALSIRRLFVEEESVSEISRTTGLSANSVYQWRTRIRKAALELRFSSALD